MRKLRRTLLTDCKVSSLNPHKQWWHVHAAAQENGLKLGFYAVWGGGTRNVEAHFSFKQQWSTCNCKKKTKTWVGVSNSIYLSDLTDGAVLVGWDSQDLAAAGSVWQKNRCLVQTSLYHTALHAGMVKFRHEEIWISVSDTRAWKSKLQVMPLLRGAFLAPPPPFEAYFGMNATFPLLSLPSLWKKQGTRVQWTGDKHFMQRFLSFCQAANYIYNNRKQQKFPYTWKMFSAIKI